MEQLRQYLTASRLTEILQFHGHLPSGRITTLAITKMEETPPSLLAHLTVTYTADAPVGLPSTFIFKQPKPHKLARGARETRFYAQVAPTMPSVPLVPCYGTGVVASTEIPYLLLADVSSTHETIDRAQLGEQHVQAMVDALARLHASCWDRPDLLDIADEQPHERLAADLAGNNERYVELLAYAGDQLTSAHRQAFERYLGSAPALLLDRVTHQRHLTLCRPDNHPENFLFPRTGISHVYIIDWHGYQCGWGASDIAVLSTRWYVYTGQQNSEQLLRTYYKHLCEYGVGGYSWEACWNDYALGVIDYLGMALRVRQYPAWLARHLPSLMRDFETFGCVKLLAR